jgi:rhamnopyranosyl-N-acetylglucosaminyl-diphospho-decaprenol beta-1,3/1,4-galactofuranosyltransferase
MERVGVVLVTHNRLALLRESLAALATSTYPIEQIILVDNLSTDGTYDSVRAEFSHVRVIRTDTNVGSAGGYSVGIKEAHATGVDWIWTLDDDSVAQPDALQELIDAAHRFPMAPSILASKVVWTDGSLHPMNIQKPKLYNPDEQFLAAKHATMSIRFTSFVSMLIHRTAIDRHGLPMAGYFLWNDDVEYSARILRKELGVLVPASVVVHKTAVKHVPATSSGEKYYFEVRNKLWICRHSSAFDRGEKRWMLQSLWRRTWDHLRDNRFRPKVLRAVIRGVAHGLTRRPEALRSAASAPIAAGSVRRTCSAASPFGGRSGRD